MRKLPRFLLALILVLGVCAPAARAAEAEIGFVVVQPGQLPAAGETFTVTVELTGGDEFSAAQFTLRYNEEEMTCTGISLGEVLSGALAASNPQGSEGAIVAAAGFSPMRAAGTVATLTFTAKTDVTAFGFALTDVVLADEGGGDLAYTVTGASAEAPPSGSAEGSSSSGSGGSTGGSTADAAGSGTGAAAPGGSADEPEAPANPDVTNPDVTNPEETATLFPETPPTFPDARGHWGEAFISRAASLGLFRGYADGSFRPDVKVSRVQFVTVLWRLAGSPAPAAQAPFGDVAGLSQEYRDAVAWGYGKQVVNGKSGGRFDPDGMLTRQEAMTILFRYSGGVSGMETMFTGTYDAQFTDSGELAAWAKPAMYWGIFHGLITGTGEHALSPGADATRAQLAKIMVQYTDQYQKEARE